MSNNSSVAITTPRELLADLIRRNLEIIETRSVCLLARTCAAYNTGGKQTLKSMLDALSDVIAAPFLRLGKQYRASPITHEITAASRKYNNFLIACKREATVHIQRVAKHDVHDPTTQRRIERIGLRFPISKLDIEELIAADEADSPATEAQALTSAQPATTTQSATTTQPATEIPTFTPQLQPATATHIPAQNQSPIQAPTQARPQNPNHKKNRFKKRPAA